MDNSVHHLTGAYVTDAVDDLERARFEAHLPSCVDCLDEVVSLRLATTALAAAAGRPAPSALRGQVLRDPLEVSPASRGRWSRTRWLAVAAAVTTIISLPWAVQGGSSVTTAQGRAAVAIGQVRQYDTAAQRISALMGAADLTTDTAQSAAGVTATVYRSQSLRLSAARLTGLPTLAAGQRFLAWNQDRSSRLNAAGGFRAEDGSAFVLLIGDARQARAFLLTILGASTGPGVSADQPVVRVLYAR